MSEMNNELAKSLEAIEEQAELLAADSEEIEKGLKPNEVAEENGDDKEEKPSEKEDGNEEEEKEADTEDKEEKEEETKKSLDFDDVITALNTMTGTSEDLRSDVVKSMELSQNVAQVLAKSFGAIMTSNESLTSLVKSQSSKLDEAHDLIKSLEARLDEVESQPVMRKSIVTAVEKSFDHSAGLTSKASATELSKSQKVEMLSNMAMNGQNGVTVNDVVRFDSTGELRQELNHVFNQ